MAQFYLISADIPHVDFEQCKVGGNLCLTFSLTGAVAKHEWEEFESRLVAFLNNRSGININDFDMQGVDKSKTQCDALT